MESQNHVRDEPDASSKAGPAARARSGTGPKLEKTPDKVDAVSVSGESGTAEKSIQDRIFTTLFEQIMPTQEIPVENAKPKKRSKTVIDRPNFSLPTMSNNFRRFNARIGAVFKFQNKATKLFSWKTPSHTLSFLAVYSFLCLEPNLLPILPLVACLLFIMVPGFYLRHPPPPNNHAIESYGASGPASAPPVTIKPAPDMSKAFFRNMRDLQNGMEDFTVIHDQIITLVAPLTNFSDERLSSALFLTMFVTTGLIYLAALLCPWRLLVLFLGWAVVCSSHPTAIALLATIDTKSIKRAIIQTQARLQRWMLEDIILDEAPEVREVEIFELQRHRSGPEWESWLYSMSPYDPQSPRRISGDRPKGTRFFEDVQAPKGWEWSDKKWSLDLLSHQWVEERMITSVEVEMEGERWVYDIGTNDASEDGGDESNTEEKPTAPKKEAEDATVTSHHGEWRRRRWTRLVKRKTMRDASVNVH